MPIGRFVIVACMCGAFIPVIWLLMYRVTPGITEIIIDSPFGTRLLLMLWPSGILMIGDPEDKNAILTVLAVALNSFIYGGIGALAWIGVKHSYAMLSSAIGLILAGWVIIWRL